MLCIVHKSDSCMIVFMRFSVAKMACKFIKSRVVFSEDEDGGHAPGKEILCLSLGGHAEAAISEYPLIDGLRVGICHLPTFSDDGRYRNSSRDDVFDYAHGQSTAAIIGER